MNLLLDILFYSFISLWFLTMGAMIGLAALIGKLVIYLICLIQRR